jgi:Family of unknown function (DUF6252)
MRATRFISIMTLLFAGACGGSSSTSLTGTNNNAPGPLSATIDGAAWSSQLPSAVVKNTIIAIAGIDNGLTTSVSLGFAASKPGTYSLGFGNSVAGNAIVTRGGKSWGSSLQGGTGSVTLTTLTANHVAGTFSFTGVASGGGATGTTVVTNGKFDITF